MVDFVTPFRERTQEYLDDPETLDSILAKGAEKARAVAAETLAAGLRQGRLPAREALSDRGPRAYRRAGHRGRLDALCPASRTSGAHDPGADSDSRSRTAEHGCTGHRPHSPTMDDGGERRGDRNDRRFDRGPGAVRQPAPGAARGLRGPRGARHPHARHPAAADRGRGAGAARDRGAPRRGRRGRPALPDAAVRHRHLPPAVPVVFVQVVEGAEACTWLQKRVRDASGPRRARAAVPVPPARHRGARHRRGGDGPGVRGARRTTRPSGPAPASRSTSRAPTGCGASCASSPSAARSVPACRPRARPPSRPSRTAG